MTDTRPRTECPCENRSNICITLSGSNKQRTKMKEHSYFLLEGLYLNWNYSLYSLILWLFSNNIACIFILSGEAVRALPRLAPVNIVATKKQWSRLQPVNKTYLQTIDGSLNISFSRCNRLNLKSGIFIEVYICLKLMF